MIGKTISHYKIIERIGVAINVQRVAAANPSRMRRQVDLANEHGHTNEDEAPLLTVDPIDQVEAQRVTGWDGQQLVWVDRPEGRDKHLQFARERKPEDPPCGSLMWEKDGISYVLDGQNLTLEKAEEYYRSLKKAKDI